MRGHNRLKVLFHRCEVSNRGAAGKCPSKHRIGPEFCDVRSRSIATKIDYSGHFRLAPKCSEHRRWSVSCSGCTSLCGARSAWFRPEESVDYKLRREIKQK